MTETFEERTAEAREAAALATLIEAARRRQQFALETAPPAPRFLLESARSMAAHMGMPERRMRQGLEPMALWQLYLPSALGAQAWDFAAVRERLPWSYARVRGALAAMQGRRQVVSAVFHMAGFPLVCTLVGAAWRDLHEGPLHLLVASRNLGWFRLERNRWVGEAVEVLDTGPAGLRRLVAGLKTESIRRLLILADGPHAPGSPGARALGRVSPALAIRTTLLAKIHELGIPLLPITHQWDAGRLAVTPRPALDPASLSGTETIDAVVGHLEELLLRHPEQWLNWSAASLRT